MNISEAVANLVMAIIRHERHLGNFPIDAPLLDDDSFQSASTALDTAINDEISRRIANTNIANSKGQ